MDKMTREVEAVDDLVEDDLEKRRKRALDYVRGIRRCISQMQRPKCKKHIKVRRLQQVAAGIDTLGVLGFDDLGDGALISAIAEAMKTKVKPERSAAFHDIYETLDLFERLVKGEVLEEDLVEDSGGEVPGVAG